MYVAFAAPTAANFFRKRKKRAPLKGGTAVYNILLSVTSVPAAPFFRQRRKNGKAALDIPRC
ncbi:MAG: hypothetical protein ACI4IS_05065 [Acutalibacteraceae bacterium]